ncbi:MAG: 30S ribosomal protein S6 [candidate division NC10 bacterium]|nr:30S ribosomal protein S6 [candidate division NC10 bacterium]
MRTYELIFILDPALGDDGVEAAAQAAKEVLAREGGEVVEIQKWGKKRLAYEIKKRREGHYVYFRMKAAPKAVAEVGRHLKISESVLNSLVHRVEEPRPAAKKAAAPAVSPAGEVATQEA